MQTDQAELVERLASGELDGSTDAPAELMALAQMVLELRERVEALSKEKM